MELPTFEIINDMEKLNECAFNLNTLELFCKNFGICW